MYKFTFTTITPLHISNGEELHQNFHYTFFENHVYKIDTFRLSSVLAKKEKINFNQDINSRTIEKWIKNHQKDIVKDATTYNLEVHQSFKAHLDNPRVEGRRQIKEFINSNGKFYVPASSVKGALLTILGTSHLGIDHKNPHIKDKVVFLDSEMLSDKKFMVYRTEERPPEINLICLRENESFSLFMTQSGSFNKDFFIRNLSEYNKIQFQNIEKEVSKYSSKKQNKIRKADLFLKALDNVCDYICKDIPVINLGFGGGSWFKINIGKIPLFNSKIPAKRHIKEAAHSSYSFTLDQGLYHIGWCKVEIEEL